MSAFTRPPRILPVQSFSLLAPEPLRREGRQSYILFRINGGKWDPSLPPRVGGGESLAYETS